MTNVIRANLLHSKVTIATSATRIPTTALPGRESLSIKNNGANIVYLGSSTVTTATGYPLASGAEISFDIGVELGVFGIVADATEELRILEGA